MTKPFDSCSRRYIVGALTMIVSLGSGHSMAREPQGGWYLGATVIGGYSRIDNFATPGFAGPAIIEHDDDWVAGLAVRLGYGWRELPIRTELELSHRYRFDLDVKDPTPGGVVDYEGNIGTTSVLFTAVAEWHNSSNFRPFAGVTLGVAHHYTDTERTDLVTGARRGRDRREANFAWGGLIGVDWDFSRSWSAEAAYRYINLGKVSTGTLFSGERIDVDDYVSHDLLLSVLYRFN